MNDITAFIKNAISVQQTNIHNKLQQYKTSILTNIKLYGEKIEEMNQENKKMEGSMINQYENKLNIDKLVSSFEKIYSAKSNKAAQKKQIEQFISDLYQLKNEANQKNNQKQINLHNVQQFCQNFKENLEKVIKSQFTHVESIINSQIKEARNMFEQDQFSKEIIQEELILGESIFKSESVNQTKVNVEQQKLKKENERLKKIIQQLRKQNQDQMDELNESYTLINKLEEDKQSLSNIELDKNKEKEQETMISELYLEYQNNLQNSTMKYQKSIEYLKEKLKKSENEVQRLKKNQAEMDKAMKIEDSAIKV